MLGAIAVTVTVTGAIAATVTITGAGAIAVAGAGTVFLVIEAISAFSSGNVINGILLSLFAFVMILMAFFCFITTIFTIRNASGTLFQKADLIGATFKNAYSDPKLFKTRQRLKAPQSKDNFLKMP